MDALVAQHMSDEVLRNSLNILKSHLKRNGLVRVQFAVPFKPRIFVQSNEFNSLDNCKSGSNIRSFEQVKFMLNEIGFYILHANISSVHPELNSAHLTLALSLTKNPIKNQIFQLRLKKFQTAEQLSVKTSLSFVKNAFHFVRVSLKKMKILFVRQI